MPHAVMVRALALITLFGLASPVGAATIEVRFTGQVTEVGEDPFLAEDFVEEFASFGIMVGTPVLGHYSFFSDTPDVNPSLDVGRYRVANGISIGIGCCYGVSPELSNVLGITVRNDFEGRDEYTVSGGGPDTFSDPILVEIVLVDPDAAAFSSDALPLFLPNLSEFATAEGQVSRAGIRFRLTSLHVVPEPSTLALLTLGLTALLIFRRRIV